jgi:hypothetical protein
MWGVWIHLSVSQSVSIKVTPSFTRWKHFSVWDYVTWKAAIFRTRFFAWNLYQMWLGIQLGTYNANHNGHERWEKPCFVKTMIRCRLLRRKLLPSKTLHLLKLLNVPSEWQTRHSERLMQYLSMHAELFGVCSANLSQFSALNNWKFKAGNPSDHILVTIFSTDNFLLASMLQFRFAFNSVSVLFYHFHHHHHHHGHQEDPAVLKARHKLVFQKVYDSWPVGKSEFLFTFHYVWINYHIIL